MNIVFLQYIHSRKNQNQSLEVQQEIIQAIIIQQYHEISEQLTTLQSLINSLKR
ncbi:hypothetical protein SC1083_0393 [Aggregatibacter actinomycetemcomitans serotype e str. SC1083]|uniref:Uncharacterized protein n=2 Tax=Aggregatibacter actinomycetemcomitans TaxID=714 RepID=Q9F265_AGGAC|nr:unknown [Aggregatibacter actinomycetemcomitans]EGY34784.1 hypothetical protein SC1083_0393 [Aggregatibacter actinomycetemcomitans serotype e str. SC1083]KYK72449.1 hypothetical protein SA3096_10065 [Aggregatibacter actinomycetemcomitans serotype e str. SA3096]